MGEIWKAIDGYNGRYEISNHGRIKSFAQDRLNGKIKTGYREKKGYLCIRLYNSEGKSKWHKIHRLVASAFIPNPNHLEQVNHKDEKKDNNYVDNLEWCTNSYNTHYGTKIERVALSNRCCPTTSLKVKSIDESGKVEFYNSIGEASRMTGCSHSNIVRTLKGRSTLCGNKHWFYC